LKAVIAVPGIVIAYAFSYRVLGMFDGNQRVTDAATALYFSVVTWTTLGYGDVRPTPEVRLLAASEALIGYIAMAVFVGLFINVLMRWFFENNDAASNQRE
jgi:voltage-gated potassium channel Kch